MYDLHLHLHLHLIHPYTPKLPQTPTPKTPILCKNKKKLKKKLIFKYTHEMGVLGVGVCGDLGVYGCI